MSSISGTVPAANISRPLQQPTLDKPAQTEAQPKPLSKDPWAAKLPLVDAFEAESTARSRQASQLHRIADGVSNGSITAKEASELLKTQQGLTRATDEALADGKITEQEKLSLGVRRAAASLSIETASNNKDRSLAAQLGLNANAKKQATQLHQLADGRKFGTITNPEAVRLLGQQANLAEARSDSKRSGEVDNRLAAAARSLDLHDEVGTQTPPTIRVGLGKGVAKKAE